MNNLVLLTGATGFVGRHILRTLLDKGCDVRIVLRDDSRLAEEDRARIHSIIHTEDFFSETEVWLKEALHGVDIVIHAAWYVEHQDYLSSEENLDCVRGTLNMAKLCVQVGIKRFVGIGTCFEYQVSSQGLSVDTRLAPKFLYSACKASIYLILENIFKNKIDFLWCRLFYLYGSGENENRLIPYIHAKLNALEQVNLTDGAQIRDYLDVKIAAQDIVNLAFGKRAGVFNICSGIGKTIHEIATEIADQYGRQDLLKFGVVPIKNGDPDAVVGIKNY